METGFNNLIDFNNMLFNIYDSIKSYLKKEDNNDYLMDADFIQCEKYNDDNFNESQKENRKIVMKIQNMV